MKYVAILNGKEIAVEITKKENQYCLTIDNQRFTVDAFRPRPQILSMLIEGQSYEAGFNKNDNAYSIFLYNDTIDLELIDSRRYQTNRQTVAGSTSGPVNIQAPMPGKIVKVTVTEKSIVNEGDSLLVMEAMKMQNELKAPKAGMVKRIDVKEGEPVSMSQTLMVLE